jgi:hypothetical protein
MLELIRKHTYFTLPSVLGALGYLLLAYFIPRENSNFLLPTYSGLFILAWFQYRKVENETEFRILVKASIFFRLIFLFSIPLLSDDYFRFIWDGRLVAHGINPFSEVPRHFLGTDTAGHAGLTPELLSGMNSPEYYSIYPPVLQFIFGIAAWIFPGNLMGSLIVMRLFILLAELGSAWLMLRLLKYFRLPEKNALLYLLNPLVIVELTGNLHFEAIMIFFVLSAIYLLTTQRFILSGVAMALAICSKLLPLVFLPLLIRFVGWKKTTLYSLLTLSIAGCLFVPFIDYQSLQHFLTSTNLYFQKFEFNASVFYLVRWIGFQVNGYDVIQTAGPILSGLVFIFILGLAFGWPIKKRENNLVELMLLALSIYFLFASIVHPWYITTLVALCVFSDFRFPIYWSILIPLTYLTYRTSNYHEIPLVIGIEYLVVGGVFCLEIISIFQRKKPLPLQTE